MRQGPLTCLGKKLGEKKYNLLQKTYCLLTVIGTLQIMHFGQHFALALLHCENYPKSGVPFGYKSRSLYLLGLNIGVQGTDV